MESKVHILFTFIAQDATGGSHTILRWQLNQVTGYSTDDGGLVLKTGSGEYAIVVDWDGLSTVNIAESKKTLVRTTNPKAQ